MLRNLELKPRILVVDDEPGICLAINLLLKERYDVDTAQTVPDVLQQLPQHHDMILLDLRIPGVAGYDLLDRILTEAPGTPVVVLSASGDSRTYGEVTQHGAAGLIEKPFTRQALLDQIQAIIQVECPIMV